MRKTIGEVLENRLCNECIMNLNPGSIFYDWGYPDDIELNFGKGVKIELVDEEVQYIIFSQIW